MTTDVRVRIAPSPTGFLHVGTARTALFNYLFAKKHSGQFILRIEDTDLGRSQKQYTENIFTSLQALGLQWDEGPDVGGQYGPYTQSERLPIYQQWANRLLEDDHAYYCHMTQAELDAEREHAQQEKRAYIYSGACRDASIREKLASLPDEHGLPRKPSLRFKIAEDAGTLTFTDHVRGELAFDTTLLGDFVLMKSDGTPSYNFAVVVDDLMMKISHVIRGEDHISNTPRQLLIYKALGETPPEFAHVGMILAPDRTKLSKRHGAVAVSEYIQNGYLPEAFCNFMALMGWSPPDGEEIGTVSHFASQFELSRLTHSPAIFETDKLNFLNGKRIRTMPLEQLLEVITPFLPPEFLTHPQEKLLMMLDAVREPLVLLSEFPDALSYFSGRSVQVSPAMIEDVLTGEEPENILKQFQAECLTDDKAFETVEALSAKLKAFTQLLKPIKVKTIMWTIRAATTGRVHGADLAKILFLLGHEIVVHRVEEALSVFV
jgi:glutamyl-tRNA synthetase